MGDVDRIANVVVDRLSWMKGFRLSARALIIDSATKLIELAGGGPGVARVGDGAGYLYAVVVLGSVSAVYWSAKSGVGSAWTLVASGPVPPVDGVTTGTAITITTGSSRVTCG